MVYLWDNYIQFVFPQDCSLITAERRMPVIVIRLTDARKVMFVGHGPGCAALMSLIHQRCELLPTRVLPCSTH